MDLIDILFSKALLKSSGGEGIDNDVATKKFVNAAIDAIKNGVSEDHDTLKEIEDTLTTKLTEPTEGLEVGKYFRIAAIDKDGHAVLETVDAPTISVKDVQVDGASVVANGVANVPIASLGNYGVIRGSTDYGYYITDGVFACGNYTAEQLSSKINNSFIGKGSLFNLLSTPSKMPALTEAEQVAARERVGAADVVTVNELKDNMEYYLNGVQFNVNDSALLVRQVNSKCLEEIALNNKTYRDIFVTANLSNYRDFRGVTTSDLKVSSGKPTVTSEESYAGSTSLKCFGVGSLAMENFTGLQANHSFYCALKMRVDNFVSGGGPGLQLYSPNQKVNARNSTPSLMYSTISAINNIGENSSLNAYYGVFGEGNANAYIDNIVVIDLNEVFGDDIPDKTSLDAAYDKFSEIVHGAVYSVKQDEEYSNEECYKAFVKCMNKKAEEMGITIKEGSSYFYDASGLSTSNKLTPLDALTLCANALNTDKIARIMGLEKATIYLPDNETPEQTIYHNLLVDSSGLSGLFGDYKMLGGKGGSLSYTIPQEEYYRSNIMFFNIDGHTVITSMMCYTNDNEIFKGMYIGLKELCDIIHYDIVGGSRPSTNTLNNIVKEGGGGYCAVVLKDQPQPGVYSIDYMLNSPLYTEKLYEDILFVPASVTKVLTALTALDWIQDNNAYITVNNYDLGSETQSGIIFKNGDRIRIKDCMYLMLLRSNNIMANALARTIGQSILSSFGRDWVKEK